MPLAAICGCFVNAQNLSQLPLQEKLAKPVMLCLCIGSFSFPFLLKTQSLKGTYMYAFPWTRCHWQHIQSQV